MSVLRQEQLRHQYLEALGISSWLPRAQLPGAAASSSWVEHFTWPEQDSAFDEAFAAPEEGTEEQLDRPSCSAPSTPAQPAIDASAAVRAQLSQLTQTPPVQPRMPPVVEQGPAPSSTAAAEPTPARAPNRLRHSTPRVKLAFVLAGDLLIVDSLPPAGRQGFGPAHQRLLAGIARALGVQERPSEASLLPWPPFAGATLNQGADELARAVARKLNYTLSVRSISRALLLGEAATQWLLGREEPLDELRGIRFNLQPGVVCVASASLSQALQLPDIKAEIWRDIQPLVPAS